MELLSQKVGCAVINAGDGAHEHPTQALLDALTIRQHKGRLAGLTVAICGDIANSRVARSNLLLLGAHAGADPRDRAADAAAAWHRERWRREVFTDMREGLKGADVVMMLRLQHERAAGRLIPSVREYYRFYGLDADKLALAKPDAIVMHPGPMNRGVEIDPAIADGPRSVINRAGRDGRRGAHGGARCPAGRPDAGGGMSRPLVIKQCPDRRSRKRHRQARRTCW